jgi:hypothetical protein
MTCFRHGSHNPKSNRTSAAAAVIMGGCVPPRATRAMCASLAALEGRTFGNVVEGPALVQFDLGLWRIL